MATIRTGEELPPSAEQEQDAVQTAKRKRRQKRKKKQESELRRLGLQPRLLKLAIAAQYLSISTGSLRRIIQAGEIDVIKLSDGTSPWLVDQRSLDAWVDRAKGRL